MFSKNNWVILRAHFALITFMLWMFQSAHNMLNDMLCTPDTHNMSKTCTSWTQYMFRCHNVKTNGANGRLREKNGSNTFSTACIYNLRLIYNLPSKTGWRPGDFRGNSLKYNFFHYEHRRPGQVCGMLPVPEDNLSSMIYLSSNGLSGRKRMLNCKQ
jgi:hypothetical protein